MTAHRLIATLLALVLPVAAWAQTTPAPEQGWVGSIAAGISFTGGNTSTVTSNLAFTVHSDKTARNVLHAEGLNIRSSRDGDAIVDRTSVQVQDDYSLTTRLYVFGRMQYLRDLFKGIDYLMAPAGGVGYRVLNTMSTTLTADVAAGGVVEKNPGVDRRASAALSVGEKLTQRISTSASLTQSFAALWKTSDFADSLVTVQAGLATDITPRMQAKVDFLDTYKNRPPSVLLKKNDMAVLLSFAFRF